MKTVFYNEIRHLRSTIRDRLMDGECVYRGQQPPALRWEDPKVEAAYMETVKTHGGRRLLSKRDVGKMLDSIHKINEPKRAPH